jgi:hypothetical protein
MRTIAAGHTAVAVGEKIVIYGGTNAGITFDDVWEFDTGTFT